MEDKHNEAIPAEELAKVQEEINVIAKLLKLYLPSLTPKELQSRFPSRPTKKKEE